MRLDLDDADVMWNFVNTDIWSTLEIYIAMVGGTPILVPLFEV